MKIILSESTLHLIENYQLAQKYLGDKLTQEELDNIKENCQYPQYLSVFAWCYLEDMKQNQTLWALNEYYANDNILRLKTLSDPVAIFKNQDRYFGNIGNLIMKRKDTLLKLKFIKSEYLRNLQKFLNKEFTFYGLNSALETVNQIISWLKLYDGYPDSELKTKILRTAFSSKTTTLEEISTALYTGYEEDLHFKDFESSENVKKAISEQDIDATIYYDKNNILLLRVDSQKDLRALTCNAKYCFSRVGNQRDWYTYAGGEYVFLLFDFNYNFPDYLTVILPHLYAYTADNSPIGEDEPDSRKVGASLLKKYLNKSDLQYYLRQSKDFYESYQYRIKNRF